jgi:hypothetical protein
MLIRTNLWHPSGAARQYEAAGSRTSFYRRWDPSVVHAVATHGTNSNALQLMLDVMTDEQKLRWF